MAHKPATKLGRRIDRLRGKEKNAAQELLKAVQSAEAMIGEPNSKRADHWQRIARQRTAELDEFLWRNGA